MAAPEPVPQLTNSRSHARTHSGRDGARAPRHPLRPRGNTACGPTREGYLVLLGFESRLAHVTDCSTISRRAQLLEQGHPRRDLPAWARLEGLLFSNTRARLAGGYSRNSARKRYVACAEHHQHDDGASNASSRLPTLSSGSPHLGYPCQWKPWRRTPGTRGTHSSARETGWGVASGG